MYRVFTLRIYAPTFHHANLPCIPSAYMQRHITCKSSAYIILLCIRSDIQCSNIPTCTPHFYPQLHPAFQSRTISHRHLFTKALLYMLHRKSHPPSLILLLHHPCQSNQSIDPPGLRPNPLDKIIPFRSHHISIEIPRYHSSFISSLLFYPFRSIFHSQSP